MNRLLPPFLPMPLGVTQAADGMPRRAWTIEGIEAAVRAGIFDEDERFELIGGEIVPMSPKGAFHEQVRFALLEYWYGIRPKSLGFMPEPTLRLDEKSFVEPDFYVFDRTTPVTAVNPTDVLLAVEIADTSLHYDLGRKIGIYAAYGLREVWVIDARSLVTRVHRKLGASGYAETADFAHTKRIAPMLAPELALRLADLGLKPTRKRG